MGAQEEARRRRSMRIAPVYPMAPVRAGAPLEEFAAFLEADQTDRDYLATSREYGFMHPLTRALSEYRAISQTAHERIEYRNRGRLTPGTWSTSGRAGTPHAALPELFAIARGAVHQE